MSYSGIYTIDLNNYKEFKTELIFLNYFELNMIAREMIYYIHYTNLIMNYFLSSDENIENVFDKINIITLEDYMNGSELI